MVGRARHTNLVGCIQTPGPGAVDSTPPTAPPSLRLTHTTHPPHPAPQCTRRPDTPERNPSVKQPTQHEFQHFPDLANRALAGSVVYATDESFAERENLIMPHAPAFDPAEFGNKGKVYDGWETRRRRHGEIGGYDFAIVRLGIPGVVRGVIVDTAWFTGNFPTHIAVWGTCQDALLDGEQLAALPADAWFPLVQRSPAQGHHQHAFEIGPGHPASGRRVTHVKLDMIPDGGIARLRVHGEPTPDPRFLQGTIDVAALENGARVTECSNMFYSSPAQAIGLGRALNMGGGWENARRRGDGNDHVTVQLAGEARLRWVEVDTSYFVFNAPGEAQLTGIAADGSESVLVPRTRLLPDTRHRFLVGEGAGAASAATAGGGGAAATPPGGDVRRDPADDPADGPAVTQVRVDVYPDGGLARLRVWGELTQAGLAAAQQRWSAS